VGRLNWFHLSNVLPLRTRGIPLTPGFRLKMQYLGWRIRASLPNADVVSAESEESLALLGAEHALARVVSVNGSDDELAFAARRHTLPSERVAVAVGTYTYKAIPDALRVFQALRERGVVDRLVIIGDLATVPTRIHELADVTVTGSLPRPEVIGWLERARVYISTTHVENSWNAAAEGLFLAEESWLSDIGPHRELLRNTPAERVEVPGVARPLLRVRRADASVSAIKSWDQVVDAMLSEAERTLQRVTASA